MLNSLICLSGTDLKVYFAMFPGYYLFTIVGNKSELVWAFHPQNCKIFLRNFGILNFRKTRLKAFVPLSKVYYLFFIL